MKTLLAAIFSALLAVATPAWAQKPGLTVVTSIKPVHSLVAAVMKGAGKPHLIVRGLSSPHAYSMRPSDARALQQAKLIFWIGPEFEAFLRAPLSALSHGPKIVAMAEIQGIEKRRLPDRHHDHDHADEGNDHPSGPFDLHLWLDPHNAIAMVRAAETALAAADPGNAALYRSNSQETIVGLQRLTASVEKGLSGVRGRPFIVFHDAYAYFEHRFGLRAAAAIAVNPETPPGAKRVAEIQARISELGVVCVFAEPQFSSKLVALLTEGTGAKPAHLDPLGALSEPGPEHYPKLIRQLAASFRDCLSP